jgi:hypothetical protein
MPFGVLIVTLVVGMFFSVGTLIVYVSHAPVTDTLGLTVTWALAAPVNRKKTKRAGNTTLANFFHNFHYLLSMDWHCQNMYIFHILFILLF